MASRLLAGEVLAVSTIVGLFLLAEAGIIVFLSNL
jgi:hypothetical protein